MGQIWLVGSWGQRAHQLHPISQEGAGIDVEVQGRDVDLEEVHLDKKKSAFSFQV